MEQIIAFLTQSDLPFFMIWLIAFVATLTENIFPPTPGDTILIFIGTLIGLGKVDFVSTLLFATCGSTIGFVVMFLLGRFSGEKLIAWPHLKFISEESMRKPKEWCARWGYWLVVANRFLSGTRAVISFVAGVTEMRLDFTIILSVISSLIWNSFLLLAGKVLGDNWRLVHRYITLYGYIIVPLLLAVIIFFIVRKIVKKKKNNRKIA